MLGLGKKAAAATAVTAAGDGCCSAEYEGMGSEGGREGGEEGRDRRKEEWREGGRREGGRGGSNAGRRVGGAQALPVQGSLVQLLVLGGGAGQRK